MRDRRALRGGRRFNRGTELLRKRLKIRRPKLVLRLGAGWSFAPRSSRRLWSRPTLPRHL
jgi:hypothetical protein